MRIKGISRIDKTIPIGIDYDRLSSKKGYRILINGIPIIGSDSVRITTELLHSIVTDYAFCKMYEIDTRYSVYALIKRRKATRRIMHDADKMHDIIDANYNCSLLSRGKPYAWIKEVYDFKAKKFIEKNLQ